MAKTACILYGFAEGPRHGKRMRAALRARGFRLIADPAAADVIIAHSGGYLMLPKLRPQQQLLLIDPAYKPGQTPRQCFRAHVWYDFVQVAMHPKSTAFWLWKTGWSWYYMATRFGYQRALYQRYKTVDFKAVITRPNTYITQSLDRSWFAIEQYPKTARQHIHHVQTGHDDCWQHPETYLTYVQPLSSR